MIKVTVGIICRNEQATIEETIRSILKQNFKDFEIIVVDGNSKDATPKIVRRVLNTTKIPHKFLNERDFGGRGRSFARNLVVKKGAKSSSYIAFTDADCVVDRNWLSVLYDAIQSTNKEKKKKIAGAGGCRLIYKNDPWLAKSINHVMTSDVGSGNNAAFKGTNAKYIESIPNYNAMYKKDVLIKYPYDVEMVGGDDLELNFRLKRNGYTFLYQQDAIVYHHQENSLYSFAYQMYDYGRVMAQATRKHGRLLRVYSVIPTLFLLFNIIMIGLSFYARLFAYAYAAVIGLYLLFLAYSTIKLMIKNKSWRLVIAPIIFITQHVCYGAGFLLRILRK